MRFDVNRLSNVKTLLIAAFAAACWLPTVASAGAPQTLLFEGALAAATGGPVVDGKYNMTFKLYASQNAQVAFWTEQASLQVTSGRVSYALGSTTPVNATAMAGASQVWLGVAIGLDPELPRRQLHSVAYALHAKQADIALGLACTGCVKASSLKWDSDLDLSGNSLKAKQVTASTVNAQQIVAQQYVGDGSKLTGIKIPSGSCPSGQYVTGIDQSGNLICKEAQGTTGGALEQVSNGALTNQFTKLLTAPKKNVPIPDNTGIDALSNISVPDVGSAKKVTVTIEMTNTDLSNVSVLLLPPNDKKVGYAVCDPCGVEKDKAFKKAYTGQLKVGDLGAWIGKNPKGLWNLKVKDTSFCLPQVPGNAGICDVKNSTDGVVKDWSIGIDTVSAKDVKVNGVLVAQAGIQVGASSAPCTDDRKGTLRYLDGSGLQVCDGKAWTSAVGGKVIHYLGTCTSNGSSSTRTFCLNKTLANTAQDYLTVTTTNTGTSSSFNVGRVLFKKKGYYRVTWHQRSRGNLQAWLYKNGSQVHYQYDQSYSSYYGSMSGSRIMYFDVNNYFNIRFYSQYNAWYANDSTLEIEYLGQ